MTPSTRCHYRNASRKSRHTIHNNLLIDFNRIEIKKLCNAICLSAHICFLSLFCFYFLKNNAKTRQAKPAFNESNDFSAFCRQSYLRLQVIIYNVTIKLYHHYIMLSIFKSNIYIFFCFILRISFSSPTSPSLKKRTTKSRKQLQIVLFLI